MVKSTSAAHTFPNTVALCVVFNLLSVENLTEGFERAFRILA